MRVNQVRSWINRWSSQVTVVAIVLLGVAFFIVIKTGRDSAGYPEPVAVYYYDLNTGELFSAMNTEIPPIPAPSGTLPNGQPAGVRAFVYSCGDCSDPAQRRIAWLEKYTPRAKAHAQAVQQWSGQDGPMPDSELDLHYDPDYMDPEYMPQDDEALAPTDQPSDGAQAHLPHGDDMPSDMDSMNNIDGIGVSIDAFDDGQLVKRPDDEHWVKAFSEKGMAITATDIDVCGEGELFTTCRP